MCLFAQLFGQRQDSSLIRCQSRVEVHYHTGVVLLSIYNFFVIRLGNDGQEQTLYAQGRLDNVRDVLGVGLRVEVFQRLAAVFLVLCQVVVGSVCNAPQLAPAKGETILEVCGCLGVEAQLFLVVVTQTQVLFLQTQIQQEVLAVATPVLEPFQVVSGLQKNSSSICSNSRTRKIKLPGVISLRKDLPI